MVIYKYSLILIYVIRKGFIFWLLHGKSQASHLPLTEFPYRLIIPDYINISSLIILYKTVIFRSIYSSDIR